MNSYTLAKTYTRKKRVGRGGAKGKTSGRGHKGQLSRAGGKPRPMFRDVIKKIPKLRGHGKNRARTVRRRRPYKTSITLNDLKGFKEKFVSPKTLLRAGLITCKKGKPFEVKILGNGEISEKLNVVGCNVSKTAKRKIEKAGGNCKI